MKNEAPTSRSVMGAEATCDKATMVAARLSEADEISSACAKRRTGDKWRTSTIVLVTHRAITLWKKGRQFLEKN